ncbi:MAG: hypothetical protein EZS28_026530 [Streblomastix strix]|uniref:TLC domain-containing protein n=1 Tax=Streblomastix strix TaxID=222440 RepID=A0A5J4V6B1_9EUKA|nr:MAG: hypothetical protein EZS28_026530 [Streblomastix strix]
MTNVRWIVAVLFLPFSIFTAIIRIIAEGKAVQILCQFNYFRIRKTGKFISEMINLLFYLAMGIVECICVVKEHLLWDLKKCWINFAESSISLRAYSIYCFESLFYLSEIGYILIFQKKNATSYSLIVHHITTLMLLFYSYQMGAHRIGIVILVLHNWSELVVCIGKALLSLGHYIPAVYAFLMLLIDNI